MMLWRLELCNAGEALHGSMGSRQQAPAWARQLAGWVAGWWGGLPARLRCMQPCNASEGARLAAGGARLAEAAAGACTSALRARGAQCSSSGGPSGRAPQGPPRSRRPAPRPPTRPPRLPPPPARPGSRHRPGADHFGRGAGGARQRRGLRRHGPHAARGGAADAGGDVLGWVLGRVLGGADSSPCAASRRGRRARWAPGRLRPASPARRACIGIRVPCPGYDRGPLTPLPRLPTHHPNNPQPATPSAPTCTPTGWSGGGCWGGRCCAASWRPPPSTTRTRTTCSGGRTAGPMATVVLPEARRMRVERCSAGASEAAAGTCVRRPPRRPPRLHPPTAAAAAVPAAPQAARAHPPAADAAAAREQPGLAGEAAHDPGERAQGALSALGWLVGATKVGRVDWLVGARRLAGSTGWWERGGWQGDQGRARRRA